MRKVAFLLLIGCATLACGIVATAGETWKWKDANGVVHYSDRPVPGAERVDIVPPKPSSSAPKSTSTPRNAVSADSNPPANQAIVPYSRCVVTTPDNDEAFNAINTVGAALLIEPALQPGHRIEVLLNGSIVKDWPQEASSHTLTGLDRGSYTLSARVLDSFGGAVCSGPSINFYVHLPTVARPRVTPH
jgi:Domain of unknown function (DUF4124)